jgi:hypothetical protein
MPAQPLAPVRPAVTRRAMAFAFTVAACLPCSAVTADETVRLEVANAPGDGPIECLVLLAHFFTSDLGELEAGAVLVMDFERHPDTGDLILRNRWGIAMAVENVLCGRVGDWAGSKVEIPLAALRAGQAVRVGCSASTGPEVLCRATPGPAEGG